MNKTIPLTLPESVWGKLATKADKEGRKVADLIGDAVEIALRGKPEAVEYVPVDLPERPMTEAQEMRQKVLTAHAAGWTDWEVATAFKIGKSRAFAIRHRAGLPANPPR